MQYTTFPLAHDMGRYAYISSNGRVVAGTAFQSVGHPGRAFRWIPETGQYELLPLLSGGTSSISFGISQEGRVILGFADTPNNSLGASAFAWVEGEGTYDLNEVFQCLLRDGSLLGIATDITPDDKYIVGVGYNAANERVEGFLLETCGGHNGDINCDGCVDDADLLVVLFNFGMRGSPFKLGRVDVNCDGSVDDADLLVVLFNFGSGC